MNSRTIKRKLFLLFSKITLAQYFISINPIFDYLLSKL